MKTSNIKISVHDAEIVEFEKKRFLHEDPNENFEILEIRTPDVEVSLFFKGLNWFDTLIEKMVKAKLEERHIKR